MGNKNQNIKNKQILQQLDDMGVKLQIALGKRDVNARG